MIWTVHICTQQTSERIRRCEKHHTNQTHKRDRFRRDPKTRERKGVEQRERKQRKQTNIQIIWSIELISVIEQNGHYPFSGSNSSVLIFRPWISTMIEQIVIAGLHKTIKPFSMLTKYQFPVIQSIRTMSIAFERRKNNFELDFFISISIFQYVAPTSHMSGDFWLWKCPWIVKIVYI